MTMRLEPRIMILKFCKFEMFLSTLNFLLLTRPEITQNPNPHNLEIDSSRRHV
jgi:hypothetical protein